MKSPADMRIIQIDITNACIHRCSNCTRFCGHRLPFFMDFETFKRAVNSFEGYEGTVGIMGGEPTLHPQFERFLDYINEHPYYKKERNLLLSPTKNFMRVVAQMEQDNTYVNTSNGIRRWCVNGYGLWSTICERYSQYYEKIQDTFNFQALNDHSNIMYHTPIMIRRRDLGITDDVWEEMRDDCWVQKKWSATITPKGAFFCEIAGALDMLFDGPGGWPIEPGWWRKTPDQFGEQLNWCEYCGLLLNAFTRDANDEVDDMTPWYHQKLKSIGSRKVAEGKYNILEVTDDGKILTDDVDGVLETRKDRYAENYYSRFGKSNRTLNPKRIVEIVDEQDGSLGKKLNKAIMRSMRGDLVVVILEDSCLSGNYKDFLCEYVFNPGAIILVDDTYDMSSILGDGIVAIFSPYAEAMKKATFPVIERVKNINELCGLYDVEKRLSLNKRLFEDYRYEIETNITYAVYGAGAKACETIPVIGTERVKCVSDSNPDMWGIFFSGYHVMSPEELWGHESEFDKVYVCSTHYIDIKGKLMELGFSRDRIVTGYLVL